MLNDCYQLLGLNSDSSLTDVKKAYRRLAKQNHPDRFVNVNEKIKQETMMADINEAYQTILISMKELKKEFVPKKTENKEQTEKENDFDLYKKAHDLFKAVFYFYPQSGWNYTKLTPEQKVEKMKELLETQDCFNRLLREYPDSDWAFDSEEKLKKIEDLIRKLDHKEGESASANRGWTKKGTPYGERKNF